QALAVELGAVAGDHALALQPLHPAQAGRGGQVHAFGQFGVGLASCPLQFGQEHQIGAVELDCRHLMLLVRVWRNNPASHRPSCATSQACCGTGPVRCKSRIPPTRRFPMGTATETAKSAQQPRRVENLHTDKGKVPVYATGIVEQPWDEYAAEDHATWATLFARQREILVGRASEAFLRAQDAMGMTPHAIPKYTELNRVLG